MRRREDHYRGPEGPDAALGIRGFRVSGFRIREQGFGVSGFEFRGSDLGNRVSGVISGFRLQLSGVGKCGPCVGEKLVFASLEGLVQLQGSRVSGFGIRVSG